ncbi:hypothetical protein PRZ48_014574 [Zasmidium cellare]|uniref:Xylanolytic transcriptional activator regulatory domain-containing protein n=1 Tax=Zasmidium cellare TaxID=395010 RepID=A0ABR0DZB0_ZASCE|nr:hypothetical protein PRZ48_014574 [Zasmidium cellare]
MFSIFAIVLLFVTFALAADQVPDVANALLRQHRPMTTFKPCRDRSCEYTFTQQRGPKRKHGDVDSDDKESLRRIYGGQPTSGNENLSLADKVATLEQMVIQLMPNNDASEPSPVVHGDQEASDIFQPPTIPERNLTLSSQLAVLSNAPASSPPQPQARVAISLPDPMTLWSLLKQSFECTAICYALVDPVEMEDSIRDTLLQLGYSHACREILVDAAHLPLIAVLMHTLAIGKALEVDAGDNDRPGWSFYSQGCLLAHRIAYSGELGLPLVHIHILSAIYLILVELLRSSSLAVVSAYQFATMMKLNHQSEWPSHLSDKERTERKRLWWILYYLNRRLAQKSGLPFHIRDVDIAVEDFAAPSDQQIAAGSLKQSSDPWLQALISLGRLYGLVWDGFFAAGAKNLANEEEIEVFDTRAANLLKRLPPELQWRLDFLGTAHAQGLSDFDLFRSLMLVTNVNLLRALRAMEVMDAHLAFISAFPFTRLLGYFSIVAIVESMFHVIPALDEPSCADVHASLEDSLRTAYDVVQRVAKRHHVARHALSALERVGALSKVNDYKDSSSAGNQPPEIKAQQGNEILGDSVATHGATIDEFPTVAPGCSSLFADIPYLALSATELNRTMDTNWPNSDDEWQAWFTTHSMP